MAPVLDIYNLVFQVVLRIDPATLAKYTTVQDQLLYLILIPHAILLLFLMGFGRGIAAGHKGMGYVISIIVYLFFIWGGWYGTFLVPLTTAFWYILLIIGLFLFFISRIIHPATAGAMIGLAAKLGEKIGAKTTGAAAEKREMQKQLAIVKHQIVQLQNRRAQAAAQMLANPAAGRAQVEMLDIQLAQLKMQEAELMAKIGG